MLESRPQLSLSIGLNRRPSSQLSVPGASSPLSGPPITPQTNSFFPPLLDSYFPSFNQGQSGPSTPPIPSSSCSISGNALYPPVFPGRRGLLRRNSSLSSVSSSIGDDEEDIEREWTLQEEETVRATYDSCVAKHSLTEAPFPANGPPPSNFTNSVARQIIRAHQGPGRITRSKTRTAAMRSSGSSDVEDNSEVEMDAPAPGKWRHGLRATRLKILSLVKERQNAHLEATPRQSDPEATPKKRKPMVRQGSMDFLPSMDNTSTIARLGSMLRQPSNDSFGPKVPNTAHPSRQFNRIRMQRTNSLSTIAGSPSQPLKEKPSPAKIPTPAPASSHRMMRLGSESNVLPTASAAPMARTLSANQGKGFEGFQRPSHHSPVPPPPPSSSSDTQATSSYTSITPKKKPSPLVLGEGFSNLETPLNLHSKRPPPTSSSGLGSAFNSPVVGVYPTPESLRKDGDKRKSWKKAKLEDDSESEDKMALDHQQPGTKPTTFVTQAQAFALPSQTDSVDALEFSIKRRLRPSLSSSSSFSNASTSSSIDSTSDDVLPVPRVVLTPSLSPTSDFSSSSRAAREEPGTPSPLSSTFDLNDLKLENIRDDSTTEEEQEEKTGLGFGFLDRAYVEAGNEAKSLRERYGDFAWAIEQQQQQQHQQQQQQQQQQQ
ncbi:uncharacterized protein JCM6883_001637 [Sporobolomyces salmoneus]|uniref:uncharacterized protein n=1 Tax=Sporobolomyces salmoneus TaxID=183962 RepID=UPI00317FF595